MAQKFLNLEKAAEALGVSIDEVKQMRERQELYGYRDGADWKFKAEDIERLAQERQANPPEGTGDDADVLLSEVELGQSGIGSSGTVIGQSSDEGEEINIGSAVSGFEELDMTLDQDPVLEDSQIQPPGDASKGKENGSTVDLMDGLEDDDLVLGGSNGGSGSGSDITIGGDSGISLVDPTDSGLSLEEPLELAGSGEESLELGEDDMISFSESADTEAPTELKAADSDFLLTPLEEAGEDEDSESGSQVIALDTEDDVLGSSSAVASASGSMPPMLDEELGEELSTGLSPLETVGEEAAPLGGVQDFGGGQPTAQPAGAAMALPEAPYSVWNIVSLAFCAFFLMLAGMMMYDLVRNMWSWNTPYQINSSIMDAILGMLGK